MVAVGALQEPFVSELRRLARAKNRPELNGDDGRGCKFKSLGRSSKLPG